MLNWLIPSKKSAPPEQPPLTLERIRSEFMQKHEPETVAGLQDKIAKREEEIYTLFPCEDEYRKQLQNEIADLKQKLSLSTLDEEYCRMDAGIFQLTRSFNTIAGGCTLPQIVLINVKELWCGFRKPNNVDYWEYIIPDCLRRVPNNLPANQGAWAQLSKGLSKARRQLIHNTISKFDRVYLLGVAPQWILNKAVLVQPSDLLVIGEKNSLFWFIDPNPDESESRTFTIDQDNARRHLQNASA